MHESRSVDASQRLGDGVLDPEPVDVAHREHGRVQLVQQRPFPVVEGADPDERDAAGIDRRERQIRTVEGGPGEAHRRRQHHAVDVPAGAGLGTVEVAVRVDPDHPAGLSCSGKAAQRPQCDRVIAAQHEWKAPILWPPPPGPRPSSQAVRISWRYRVRSSPTVAASATQSGRCRNRRIRGPDP